MLFLLNMAFIMSFVNCSFKSKKNEENNLKNNIFYLSQKNHNLRILQLYSTTITDTAITSSPTIESTLSTNILTSLPESASEKSTIISPSTIIESTLITNTNTIITSFPEIESSSTNSTESTTIPINQQTKKSGGLSVGAIVVIILCGVIILIVIVVITFLIRRKRNGVPPTPIQKIGNNTIGINSSSTIEKN